MTPCRAAAAVISASFALGLGSSAFAQEAQDIGRYEYHVSCAVCHGDTGKGDGPLMKYYGKTATDLTTLQKNNFGAFPFDRVYEVVDGRQMVRGHGTSDMPVWGDVYSQRQQSYLFGFGTAKDSESYVRGRIVALIGYIYSLQAK